ncbi:hypothetical protein SteCoe_24496 [Stentor coeruleus]|uniref:G domain-containing protein n=1 Tax=Stentor coeruleus TaxID=5963 RepID=A0A1R2BHG9_9CILI|nr:hypothetical protein SteCoe_24496 [Stentor coeruleus]
MAQLSVVRPGEPLEPYDYSILILGASGNGKSTFVNTLVNVIIGNRPGNLQVAVACYKYPNIIPALDDGLHDYDDGKTQTTHAHFYKLKSSITENKTILVIHTPGFALSEDDSGDDNIAQIIINAALRTKYLNAIIIIQNSSYNRLSPCLEYSLYRISEIIPKEFENQVILVLTFNSGATQFQDRWLLFPIQYKVKINNIAFKYSSNEYQAKPYCINRSDWDRSAKKVKKIVIKLFTMPKVPTIHFIGYPNTR